MTESFREPKDPSELSDGGLAVFLAHLVERPEAEEGFKALLSEEGFANSDNFTEAEIAENKLALGELVSRLSQKIDAHEEMPHSMEDRG